MTQFYQYRSALRASDAWVEGLGNARVRLGTLSLTTLAEHLQVGQSSIILDDPDADLGHDGDTILAHHRFELIEDDSTDDEHIVITFIGERKFRRGDSDRPSLRLGVSRQIELSLLDLNCIPSFRLIDPNDDDADRPAETVDDRLAWILGSSYLLNAVHDDGVVESNTTLMDAADYGGQTAANVIGDCELAAGFGWNAWIYYVEDAGHYSLGFINANTSTLYSSDLRISNLLSDLDTLDDDFETGTTFAPLYDSELSKDPSNLISGIFVPYQDNYVYRTRTATSDIYGPREQAAPNSNVKTATRAGAVADDFLFQHRNDADNIHVAIEVPTSKANAIKAGHRLQVKFTHLPGYETFTWCRVIRRTIIQEQATDRYVVDMDLSPQEPGCSGDPALVQYAYQDENTAEALDSPPFDPFTLRTSLDDPPTKGNVIGLAVMASGTVEIEPDHGPWETVVSDVEFVTGYNAYFYWKVSDGTEQDVIVGFDASTGARRFLYFEYEGLTDAAQSGTVTTHTQSPNTDGFAIVPATPYPSGAAAVWAICFMLGGPETSDDLGMTGSITLVNPIHGTDHSSGGEIALAHILRNTGDASGTTPYWPTVGDPTGLLFDGTDTEPTYTIGVVITGESC